MFTSQWQSIFFRTCACVPCAVLSVGFKFEKYIHLAFGVPFWSVFSCYCCFLYSSCIFAYDCDSPFLYIFIPFQIVVYYCFWMKDFMKNKIFHVFCWCFFYFLSLKLMSFRQSNLKFQWNSGKRNNSSTNRILYWLEMIWTISFVPILTDSFTHDTIVVSQL